jgi:hypothetical protein
MSTPEEVRTAAQTADSHASATAYAEREARLGADIAAMQAGPTEHLAGLTDHHQGLPAVETQQATHGAAAPRLPDTGGHQSASDHIG